MGFAPRYFIHPISSLLFRFASRNHFPIGSTLVLAFFLSTFGVRTSCETLTIHLLSCTSTRTVVPPRYKACTAPKSIRRRRSYQCQRVHRPMHGVRGESKFTPTGCPCAIQLHYRCIQALVPQWAAMYLYTLHRYRGTSPQTSIHTSLHTSLHLSLYPYTHLYLHLSSPQPARQFSPIGERGVQDGELKGLREAASRRRRFTLPHRAISPPPTSCHQAIALPALPFHPHVRRGSPRTLLLKSPTSRPRVRQPPHLVSLSCLTLCPPDTTQVPHAQQKRLCDGGDPAPASPLALCVRAVVTHCPRVASWAGPDWASPPRLGPCRGRAL